MNKKLASYLEMSGIAAIVIVLDQITKYIVRTNLELRETWMPWGWLEPYARIIHWKNTGVAFGLFQGSGWIFTVIGMVIVVLIIIFFKQVKEGSAFWRVALSLQLGGAIGNLIDRINPELGYVVDFVWVGNFPVFNLADTAIVIGAFVLVIGMWIEEEKDKKTAVAAEIAKAEEADEQANSSEAPAAEIEQIHE